VTASWSCWATSRRSGTSCWPRSNWERCSSRHHAPDPRGPAGPVGTGPGAARRRRRRQHGKIRNAGRSYSRLSVGGSAPGWTPFENAYGCEPAFSPDGPTGRMIRCCSISPPAPRASQAGAAHPPQLSRRAPVHHVLDRAAARRHPSDISSPGWAKHAWSCFFAPGMPGPAFSFTTTPASTRRPCLRCWSRRCDHPVRTADRLAHADPGGPGVLSREDQGVGGAGEPLNPEVIEQVKKAWGSPSATATVRPRPPPGRQFPGQTVRPGSMGRRCRDTTACCWEPTAMSRPKARSAW